MTGAIHQINTSDGGVPKLPVERAVVGERGVVGDRQNDTKHHGSPDQALCLWSQEIIQGLQREGHPIEAGSAGENITITGLDWASVRSGDRYTLGDEVEIEITFPAIPCAKNSQWFLDGNHKRIHQDLHPGWQRWYARVLHGGSLRAGDSVRSR